MLQKSDFNYSEDAQIKRNLLAHALMYFARGIPVIYYGDEQGFIGSGGDSAARQDMMPSKVVSFNQDNLLATDKTTADDNFDRQHMFYQAFAEYAALYQQYPALRYGKHNSLYSQASPGIYAFSRSIAADENPLLVLFNTATRAQTLTLKVKSREQQRLYPVSQAATNQQHQVTLTKDDAHSIAIQLPALSFAIYQAK
jgi:glycosidase